MRGTYRGYDIISMPPPSSGGVALIEMLNILEGYDLAHDDQTQALHLMIEAMKRAYADRAYFLGDPDAVKVPVARLISKRYAAEWRATIDPERATPAKDIHPDRGADAEGRPQHHAFLGDRPARQRGVQHLYAQFQLMASASSPTAPASCSTTSSTILPPSRMRRMPTACSASRPTRPARANGRSRR